MQVSARLSPSDSVSEAGRFTHTGKYVLTALLIVAGLAFVFRGALMKGLVYQEPDTLNYYFPVLVETQRALHSASLPLWSPYIYGGFPLFADGESGALYPINALLLLLTSPQVTLLWLGPLRVGMAALFMFLYVRTIGIGMLGSLISTLVFAFGGFSIAQLHHVNLSNGAVWLPLVLLLVECAYRQTGLARALMVVLAGVIFGVQAVALHVQVSLMTALFLAPYVAFRSLAFPAGRLIARLKLMVGTLAGTVGIGLGLAATQWLPLYELSRFSPRAPGLLYSQSLEYALPPINLITFISPYFFRGPNRVWWAVWSPWETVIYVGIAPLLLAAAALVWGRSRWTAFFGVTGLLSLLLAMANYLPLNLHYLLYRLPWFDALRAPGRFSYLFTFSVACLAGLGMHWLAGQRQNLKPKGLWLLPAGFLALLVVLLVGLQGLQGWIFANRDLAVDRLGEFYLGLGPSALTHLNKWDVVDFLTFSAGLPKSAGPAGFIIASCALFMAWLWRPRWRRICMLGLVLLVSADLWWFGQAFHDTKPVADLTEKSPAVSFLVQQPGGDRILSVNSVVADPNRLAPFGLQVAGGYSSLPFQRHREYTALAMHLDSPLMELWNVRYLVAGKKPSYAYSGVSFDPAMPLFSGGKDSPSQQRYVVPGVEVQEVRLISTLRQAAHIPQGTPVASLVLNGDSGLQLRVPLLAGTHTAEASYNRADVRPLVQHQRPQVATNLRDYDQSTLYYSTIALPGSVKVESVAMEYNYPTGSIDVYAVALAAPAAQVYEVRPFHLEKYRQVYDGVDGTVYEDQTVLPRAFLVPEAVSLPDQAAVLARLTAPGFDPLRTVLLEEPAPALGGNGLPATGTASIADYSDTRVLVDVDTGQPSFLFLGDSYYPGWRAYVNGNPAKIYRADYLFRAVEVPAGRHSVEFRYEPDSLNLGLMVSTATAGAVGLTVLCLSVALVRRPRR